MENTKMKSLNLLFVLGFSMQMMQGTFAAARYQAVVRIQEKNQLVLFSLLQDIFFQDESPRAEALERSILLGKSQKEVTDRDMHDDWEELRKLKNEFNDKFEKLVCTHPAQLAILLEEINKLANEVSLQ